MIYIAKVLDYFINYIYLYYQGFALVQKEVYQICQIIQQTILNVHLKISSSELVY